MQRPTEQEADPPPQEEQAGDDQPDWPDYDIRDTVEGHSA
jgi:hypothetical protein